MLEFFVLPGLKSFDGIIGDDTLKELGAIIDRKNNILILAPNIKIPLKEKQSPQVNNLEIRDNHLSHESKQKLETILSKFKNVFQPVNHIGKNNTDVNAEIKIATEGPIYTKSYPTRIIGKKPDTSQIKKYRLVVDRGKNVYAYGEPQPNNHPHDQGYYIRLQAIINETVTLKTKIRILFDLENKYIKLMSKICTIKWKPSHSSSCLWTITTPLNIYEYNNPLVTLKEGTGRIINGKFKLVHIINLTSYEEIIDRISPEINRIDRDSSLRPQLIHQVEQITQLISELKGQKPRTRRSIDWIGSAWKWVAGSPDATDWDQIVNSQNKIINNNNEQYHINTALMNTAHKILAEYNKIVDTLHEDSDERIQQMLFNRLTIIKEEIKEIIRAVQLAKGKIVNTNLLDKNEIVRLVAEIETIPYSNEVEAIEYAEPTILVKNSIILYVIAIPKTSGQDYNHVIIRSTIKQNKQIYLEYKELLLNQHELFGITRECKTFHETTICERNHLEEIQNDHCISQLIKGMHAKCEYQFNKNQIIEPLNDNTIYLSNFKGHVGNNNTNKYLEGNFLIQYNNETIRINNTTFTNREIRTSQVLPPVLQPNITEKGVKLDPEYLHDLHLNNVELIQKLFTKHGESGFMDFGLIAVVIIIIAIILFRKTTHSYRIWSLKKPAQQQEVNDFQPGIHPITLDF